MGIEDRAPNRGSAPHEFDIGDVVIEQGHVNDTLAVVEVRKRTWIQVYPDPETGITEQDIRGNFEDENGRLRADAMDVYKQRIEKLDRVQSDLLVARLGGEVVGWITPMVHEGQNRLGEANVLPELWGRGIGKKLVETSLEWHRQRGAKEVYLQVADSNDRAQGLYRHLGFVETGKQPVAEWRLRSGKTMEVPGIEMALRLQHATPEA